MSDQPLVEDGHKRARPRSKTKPKRRTLWPESEKVYDWLLANVGAGVRMTLDDLERIPVFARYGEDARHRASSIMSNLHHLRLVERENENTKRVQYWIGVRAPLDDRTGDEVTTEVTADDLATANAPEGRWEFDEGVTAAFEDMLERSVPNYADMRRFVTDAAAFFVNYASIKDPLVVDLGASRGSALQPIVDKVGARARYLACDVSEPMLAVCRERFSGWIDNKLMRVERHDLREGMPPLIKPPSVVLSILTLQFVPIEYRTSLLADIHQQMAHQGALILVEKVMGGTAEADKLINRLYWDLKADNGYTQEAIERKRMSLEGVLVPLTARFNEDMLRSAGFIDPECVWAWGPFRGWLAVKR